MEPDSFRRWIQVRSSALGEPQFPSLWAKQVRPPRLDIRMHPPCGLDGFSRRSSDNTYCTNCVMPSSWSDALTHGRWHRSLLLSSFSFSFRRHLHRYSYIRCVYTATHALSYRRRWRRRRRAVSIAPPPPLRATWTFDDGFRIISRDVGLAHRKEEKTCTLSELR